MKKKFYKFFENKMAMQNLSQSNPFLLAAGPLPVAIFHLEQKTRKIL